MREPERRSSPRREPRNERNVRETAQGNRADRGERVHEERTAARHEQNDEPERDGAERADYRELVKRESGRRAVGRGEQNRGAQACGGLLQGKLHNCAFQFVHRHDSVTSVPLRSLRSCSFARNKCVLTVPIGSPRTVAISSYCLPCRWKSVTTVRYFSGSASIADRSREASSSAMTRASGPGVASARSGSSSLA